MGEETIGPMAQEIIAHHKDRIAVLVAALETYDGIVMRLEAAAPGTLGEQKAISDVRVAAKRFRDLLAPAQQPVT